ncbi:uncharacterized protein L969DRAFT_95811 [Mixia osmundae IAM 14324]|uniref:NADH-ubiquinone oxidoreductase 21kDa subunit N-terminal domain-containing protein n=1 Tax=Mixia osmundae (strain CBS 9802 / IAM 14324 / JCM 22182 / KY 12970) TaxID=764103 RepID=G7DSI0_MIXOS|nr:uncharacterized protein L969DRAFT_95811 [Mixia osmundae IAM 14324]KEI37962.1 hypothetical protein L969DRAFT_95811 [Mixia osmundae IAM 14324]GAA93540.1 hypothetical protein E5Q_00184 [Mixia osmundae IAM 14324]
MSTKAEQAVKPVERPFALIDSDPHAKRVMSYMRPSDYAVWASATATFPALQYLKQTQSPLGAMPKHMGTALKIGGFLGFVGGFLLAYQRSTFRFWGWTENAQEVDRDYKELSARAKAGLPLYGESSQPDYIQGVAFRNSQWSQLKFQAIPWFNFVNHPYHGVDTTKYYKEAAEKE